jgi:hypothetical protein
MSHTSTTPDNAVLLLAAAADLGLDKSVVRTRFGNLTAPDEVFEKAGFTVDKDTDYATAPDSGESKPAKRTAKKTVAKKATAKKTTASAGTEN